MRVAVTCLYRHIVGGVEVYLDNLLPALHGLGCDIQLWHQHDPPDGAELLPITSTHSLTRLGLPEAMRRMAAWRPDVIFDQGVENTDWEAGLQDVAPVVHFFHAYHGTCISGNKSWQFPVHQPCARPFGMACLLHYFPHRCGGLSPLTMFRQYGAQARRLHNMRGFSSIVTASEHMRRELLNHGFLPERVLRVGLYLPDRAAGTGARHLGVSQNPNRLLYSGRMVPQKGGLCLIDAVDLAARRLGRPLNLTLAGDGPERQAWEARALLRRSGNSLAQYQFVNWQNRMQLQEFYASHGLAIVSSVWPEPFGMVVVEASQHGIPVVAFDVGGISDSVVDGISGHLASADPPTAAGLADAIVLSIEDPQHYAALCAGARRQSNQSDDHLTRLMSVLQRVKRS